jgi:hypothetical protein
MPRSRAADRNLPDGFIPRRTRREQQPQQQQHQQQQQNVIKHQNTSSYFGESEITAYNIVPEREKERERESQYLFSKMRRLIYKVGEASPALPAGLPAVRFGYW